MGQRLIITEEERNNIRQMYNLCDEQDYMFDVPHISINGKYFIYKDELYDYTINENLGNIFTVENLKKTINDFDINLLNENFSIYNNIKTLLETIDDKTILSEIKKTNKNKLLTEQENTIGGTILNWVLWFARKVKSMLWSIGGMAVDAFLVGSGIGKSVQWIPWAICLALDVYQWVSGDYGDDPENEKNSSPIWKALTIAFDILGMTTTGPFAKIAKSLFKPIQAIKSESKIAQWVAKSPKALGFLKRIQNGISKVPSMINTLVTTLSKKSPKLSKWISSLSSGITKALNFVGKTLGKILSVPGKTAEKVGNVIQGTKMSGKNLGKGLKDATNTSMIVGGIESGINSVKNIKQNKMDDLLLQTVRDPNFRL